MKINFIKYAKTVRHESGDVRFEASATLDKNENPDIAFIDLKNYVEEKCGLRSAKPEFKNTPFEKLSGVV